MLDVLLMVIIGGLGTLYGGIVGAVVLLTARTLLPDLRALDAALAPGSEVLQRLALASSTSGSCSSWWSSSFQRVCWGPCGRRGHGGLESRRRHRSGPAPRTSARRSAITSSAENESGEALPPPDRVASSQGAAPYSRIGGRLNQRRSAATRCPVIFRSPVVHRVHVLRCPSSGARDAPALSAFRANRTVGRVGT